MKPRAHVVTVATAAILLAAAPALAAGWTATGTAAASAKADSLSAPTAATAGSATSSTLTVSVTTKPATGPTPTTYRVDRTSPGTATGVCTITATAGTGSCTDTGLSPGTPYQYAIYSRIGTNWISSGSTGASGSTVTVTIINPTATSQESIKHGNTATFTITGTGFQNGIGVTGVTAGTGFTVNTVTWVDAQHLSVNVTAGNGSKMGTYDLTVTNPDGSTATSKNSMVNA